MDEGKKVNRYFRSGRRSEEIIHAAGLVPVTVWGAGEVVEAKGILPGILRIRYLKNHGLRSSR